MDTFRKEDLIYDYSWSEYEKNDPRISGIPDKTTFNRKEGREIIYLITYLTDHLAWSVEGFGSQLEKLIHNRLPEEISSQKDTFQWIKENWRNTAAGKN